MYMRPMLMQAALLTALCSVLARHAEPLASPGRATLYRTPAHADDNGNKDVECQPRMRSVAGVGTLAQQGAFRHCCDPRRASAACFAAAASYSASADADSTLALQAALNCSTDVLTVESRTWLTQPLILTGTGPRRLLFEPGARVEALRGAYHGMLDSLLTVFETDGVTIEAAGAVFHMRKEDYIDRARYNHSEHRHALHIVGAHGLSIVGLHVNNSGGDGVYVTGSAGAGCKRFSAQGLTLRSILSTRNYRQGLSVISASKMLAKNCTFADTGYGGYTSPAAGVDVEPGAPSNLLDGIRFEDCIAANNVGAGFNISPGYGGASAKKNVTITFERCHVRGGLGSGFASGGSNPRWPAGRIDIKDCSVSTTAGSGISFRNAISGLEVAYSNLTLRDVAIGWQHTRGPHSGHGTWPWWNATVGPPMQAWPIDISHTSHDVSAPVGQLSIIGLHATDKLSRPFIHADTPRNTSLAQGGLRQIMIAGIVQVESARQCTPVGIASSTAWGVDLRSLACSKHRHVTQTRGELGSTNRSRFQ